MRNFFRSIASLGLKEGLSVYVQLKNETITKIKLSSLNNDIYLRGRSSDIPTLKKIFIKKEYDATIGFEPKIIVDAGAYIGLSALFFAAKYPKAHIICIEPNKDNYAFLKRNTEGYKNITCLNTAVWNTSRLLEVKDYGHGHWGFVVEETDKESAESFTSTSISDLIKKYNINGIDILKIDIEGAEKEMFSNNFHAWLPRTKVIMIELHDHFKKGCSTAFYDALKQHNFTSYERGENIIAINNSGGH
jgi:FkbM family methyltransferase